MKKKGLKIFGMLVLVVLVIAAIGFYLWNKSENDRMSKSLNDAASDYYTKYISSNTGSSAYKVTLEDLKKANEESENYDLSDLDGCREKTTVATVNINYGTGEVTSVTSKLDCKKIFK